MLNTTTTTSIYTDPSYIAAYKACRAARADKKPAANTQAQFSPAWQGWDDAATDATYAHQDAVRHSSPWG